MLLIGAIIGALIGFVVGFASRQAENKGSAVLFGLLGAIIGGVGGVFLLAIAIVAGVLYLMFVALT